MAKLYPPIIEGTLPAFYSDTIENIENGGMVEITIPFSMNKAVSISEVKGFSLKIKTVSSNTYLLSLKILENGNGITNTILNNCNSLFLSNNELKSAELIRWQILQWLGNYCLDRNSLNNLTQIIQTHYNNFLNLKLSREEKNFYNDCIDKNQREINILSDEKDNLEDNIIPNIQSHIADAINAKTNAENRLLELNTLIPETESRVTSTQAIMNSLESQLNILNPEDPEYNSIQSQLSSAQNDYQSAVNSLNNLEEEKADVEQYINDYTTEIAGLNDQLVEKQQRILTIEAEVARLTTEIENFEEEIETLENNITYLEELLSPLLNNAISSIESIINNHQVSFCIRANHPFIQEGIFYSGQHYKMQLAYIGNGGEVGYYSTVGIAKFTTKPILYIAGLDSNIINNYRINFTGFYDQTGQDVTEKVYNYQFNLYQNGELYLTSDWLLHNSTYDDSPSSSFDIYGFETSIIPNLKYQLEYKVRTINNLEVATKLYDIIQQEALLPEYDIEVNPILNFNNAYIDLYLTTNRDSANGAFAISRTDNTSNYSNWVTLTNLSLNNKIFKNEFVYRDYSIEHGITYIYAIQQYNSRGLFSRHVKADPIFADFEDAFLYDGEKQLKIKYNPKISSFKRTLLESKIDMIGSQYPFIFRNPRVSYKEFPISGLISYHSDEESLFLSEADINLVEYSVNLTGENIASERLFKTAVLDWLTNGKPKLFKSPSEGNFIVRLMNTSLTPTDTVNRMLHTFNCNAYEIADFNFNNCKQYGFIKNNDLEDKSKVYKTVNLATYDTGDFNNLPSINPNHDAYSIEFNTNPNVYFYINGSMYYTDVEGHFKLEIEDVVFKAGSITLAPGITYSGTATYSYYGVPEEGFSNINTIEINEVALRQVTGVENILNALQDLKTEILAINYLKAYSLTDDRYYITINGKTLDFNGIDGIELFDIIEPKEIIVSSPDLIIECGYQYCNKIYNVELNLSGTIKNNYEINKEILSVINYKEMIENCNENNRNNTTLMYDELNQLQSDYLNGNITTEEEYNTKYNEIVDRYSNQKQSKIEQDYINEINNSRRTYYTDLNNYLNLVNNKLNEEAI